MIRPDRRTRVTTDWKNRLLESDAAIHAMLRTVKTVAVLGIKTERQSDQPAYWVPEYAKKAGLEVIPVPVYYPEVTTILGEKVYRSLAEIPRPVDLVNVFRRPADVLPHVDDILAKKPRAVWMQQGIRNAEAAERLARAGIDVVQDRCLYVELQRIGK
jgi:predicted CoA-binding protein